MDSRQLFLAALREAGVPAHLHEGLALYAFERILPGSFLQAVLCNDLRQAVRRADPDSAAGLFRLVRFLDTVLPS
jgi:hypothetical protein